MFEKTSRCACCFSSATSVLQLIRCDTHFNFPAHAIHVATVDLARIYKHRFAESRQNVFLAFSEKEIYQHIFFRDKFLCFYSFFPHLLVCRVNRTVNQVEFIVRFLFSSFFCFRSKYISDFFSAPFWFAVWLIFILINIFLCEHAFNLVGIFVAHKKNSDGESDDRWRLINCIKSNTQRYTFAVT